MDVRQAVVDVCTFQQTTFMAKPYPSVPMGGCLLSAPHFVTMKEQFTLIGNLTYLYCRFTGASGELIAISA